VTKKGEGKERQGASNTGQARQDRGARNGSPRLCDLEVVDVQLVVAAGRRDGDLAAAAGVPRQAGAGPLQLQQQQRAAAKTPARMHAEVTYAVDKGVMYDERHHARLVQGRSSCKEQRAAAGMELLRIGAA